MSNWMDMSLSALKSLSQCVKRCCLSFELLSAAAIAGVTFGVTVILELEKRL